VKSPFKLDIYRVGGPSSGEEDKVSHRFVASTWVEQAPQYSPDGRQAVFTSGRSGFFEIWICDTDGSNLRQLTFLEAYAQSGSWSPDGEKIAFHSRKEGSMDIYVVSSAGGIPQRMTTGSQSESAPSWSRDGRWIYFASNRTGRREVWKIPSGGGEAVQVTGNGGNISFESPDGDYLYYTKSQFGMGPSGLWRLSLDGGEEELVLESVRFCDWTIFERGICYINRQQESGPTIEIYEFATGDIHEVVRLDKQPSSFGISISPDEHWILYVVPESESDIMLVENFR
jgi:Tol biopolymer transport system component